MGWIPHPLGNALGEMGWAPAFLDKSHGRAAGLFLSLSALQLTLFAPDLAKKLHISPPKAPDPRRVSTPHLLSRGAPEDGILGAAAAKRDARPSARFPAQAGAASCLSHCNSSCSQPAPSEFASGYKYLAEQQSPQRLRALYIVFSAAERHLAGRLGGGISF